MTRDDVVKIAAECGNDNGTTLKSDLDFLVAFAQRVAAAEREACAKVCDQIEEDYWERESLRCVEHRTDAQAGASDCAYRIRARGDT